MLSKGEKIFVITRRLFEGDIRRHFIGEIQEVSGAAIRVRGYVFIFDENNKEFVRQNELRTRIFSIIDAGLIINMLPSEVAIEDIIYILDEKNHYIITDEKSFSLNVNEFGLFR